MCVFMPFERRSIDSEKQMRDNDMGKAEMEKIRYFQQRKRCCRWRKQMPKKNEHNWIFAALFMTLAHVLSYGKNSVTNMLNL